MTAPHVHLIQTRPFSTALASSPQYSCSRMEGLERGAERDRHSQYFEPSQRTIERALLALASVSLHILELFNECFDNAFHGDARWRDLRAEIQRTGHALAKATGLPEDDGGDDGPTR